MNVIKYILGMLIYKVHACCLYYKEIYNTRSVKNSGSVLGGRVNISYPQNIVIGKNSYMNGGYLCASKNASIVIGDNCMISYNVHIRTDMHCHTQTDIPMNQQGNDEKNIIIGNDVWIGYGAQVLSGVVIADGCIIGAGAVVTKDTQPYGVYVGIPAKRIKDR